MSKTITANSGAIKLTSTHAAYNPLSVNAGVTVAGGAYGVYGDASQAWSVLNHGTISGSVANGIYLRDGGVVHNYAGARITGVTRGILIAGGTANVANYGTISGATGVYLKAGGTVRNVVAGISAATYAVVAAVTAASVDNFTGTLLGGKAGVYLRAGGTVLNVGSTALLSGYADGVLVGGAAATVTNYGTLTGTNTSSSVGVVLKSGGTVGNIGSGAYIGGSTIGVRADALATITNQGSIASSRTFGTGISLAAGGVVTNSAGANISGSRAIYSPGGPTTVTNDGHLFGSVVALVLDNGGKITNGAFATINGGLGVEALGSASLTIVNQGLISGAGLGAGVFIQAGSVANVGTSAVISGGDFGVGIDAGVGTISNDGTITALYFDSIYLKTGGTVSNNTIGSDISGATYGILIGSGVATITNQGTIAGSTAAVQFANANGNLLHEFQGAVLIGPVKGGSGQDTLLLDGGGSSPGVISGIGVRITGFEQLDLSFDAQWRVTGANTVASSLTVALSAYSDLTVVGTLTAPTNLTLKGTGTLVAASTARIEVGTAGLALGGQIAVDAGHTLFTGGALSAHLIRNAGSIAALYASGDGIHLPFGGTVTNTNHVSGGRAGVFASGGLSVANSGGGNIAGGLYGVYDTFGVGTVTNSAIISGGSADGVHLADGGTVVNNTPGLIAGGQNGVYANGGRATVVNQATVTGTAAYGVFLDAGGSVTNAVKTARISGGATGVEAVQGTLTVVNQGTIIGTGEYGVALLHGGQVTNSGTSALISGGYAGIADSGGALTLVNQGTIITGNFGVMVAAASVITNSGAGAHISGVQVGIYARSGRLTVANDGTITAGMGNGLALLGGGTVTNDVASALISGANYGISGSGTIINHGTITGGVGGAVQFLPVNGNLLLTFPGAVENGAVKGGSGLDTLELGSGATAGTISGIGTQFTGFEKLLVDSGSVWKAVNANTLVPSATLALVGNASLGVTGSLVAPSNLTVTGSGTLSAAGGRIEVGTAGAALANQIVVDAGQTLVPAGVLNASTLVVASSGVVLGAGTIAAPVANSGRVQAINGGTLTVGGNLTGGTIQASLNSRLILKGGSNAAISALGGGTIEIGAAASLDITGSIDPTSTALFILNSTSLLEINADTSMAGAVSFLGAPGGRLVVDKVGQFGAHLGQLNYSGPLIENFLSADTIDLKNLLFSGATIDSFTAATGLLQLHSGASKATLLFQNSSLGAGSFHLTADSGTGTLITHS